MRGFTVTRSNGDAGCPGDFTVEDSDGVTWQVRANTHKGVKHLVCCRPVCASNDYEVGASLEADIWGAVREVLDNEQSAMKDAVEESRGKLFTVEDAIEFKKSYAIQFMASYTASRFSDCCARGQHESLRKPPVEDARHLAEEAWNHWVDVIGLKVSH